MESLNKQKSFISTMETKSNGQFNRSIDVKTQPKNKTQKNYRRMHNSLYTKNKNFLKSRYPPEFIAFILYLKHCSIPTKDLLSIANDIRKRLPKKYSTISNNLARKTIIEWDKIYWVKIKKVISFEFASIFIKYYHPKILKTINKKYYDKIGIEVPDHIFADGAMNKHQQTLKKLSKGNITKVKDKKVDYLNIQITTKISKRKLDFIKIYKELIANEEIRKNEDISIVYMEEMPWVIQISISNSCMFLYENGKCSFVGPSNVKEAKKNIHIIIGILKDTIPYFIDDYKLKINNIRSRAKFEHSFNLKDIENSILLQNHENAFYGIKYQFTLQPPSKKEKQAKKESNIGYILDGRLKYNITGMDATIEFYKSGKIIITSVKKESDIDKIIKMLASSIFLQPFIYYIVKPRKPRSKTKVCKNVI